MGARKERGERRESEIGRWVQGKRETKGGRAR